MKRRTIIGLVTGVAVALAGGAGVLAMGAHGAGRGTIMKRVVAATIDEALDQAQVTPDQRAAVHQSRDRVFAALDQHRTSRHAHIEEALRLFEAEDVDPGRLEALHRQTEAARQRIREAVHQALVEVHGVLTPAQRRAVADYVRAQRWSHMH